MKDINSPLFVNVQQNKNNMISMWYTKYKSITNSSFDHLKYLQVIENTVRYMLRSAEDQTCDFTRHPDKTMKLSLETRHRLLTICFLNWNHYTYCQFNKQLFWMLSSCLQTSQDFIGGGGVFKCNIYSKHRFITL